MSLEQVLPENHRSDQSDRFQSLRQILVQQVPLIPQKEQEKQCGSQHAPPIYA